MRLLAVYCARYPGDVQSLWDTFKNHQPAGVVTAFRGTVEGILGLLDSRLRITSQLRDLAEEIASIEGRRPVDEGVFANVLAELQNIRDHVDGIWKWASSPPGPLDLQMVKESKEAREQGEGEDVKDILDRFQATGRLLPE